jgi:hypothetical protein
MQAGTSLLFDAFLIDFLAGRDLRPVRRPAARRRLGELLAITRTKMAPLRLRPG